MYELPCAQPWVFTEIKEQRHWDISSGERFNILKDYVNCGLAHWGSDTKGVPDTFFIFRSFHVRYIYEMVLIIQTCS